MTSHCYTARTMLFEHLIYTKIQSYLISLFTIPILVACSYCITHTGSDLCRALLLFDEEKALGDQGLYWMKVHLSNLFGNNKISHDDRVAFVDSNMEKILDSVADPLHGGMWWSTAEEPFQALATMIGTASIRLLALHHTMLCHTKP
jgi:DNA-directed RNA polymerase, mitochondrial